MREFVVFMLGNEHYALDIDLVENIEKSLEVTRVPYTKQFVKGVVNLRGIIVPIIDMRKRLGFPDESLSEDSRIIIINSGENKVGLYVDHCAETTQMKESDIEDSPKIKLTDRGEFVKQVGKQNGRIIMLVDIEKVLEV